MKYNDKVIRALKRFTARYQKDNGRDAFNKWKLYSLSKVDQQTGETITRLRQRDDDFQEYIRQIKQTNVARIFSLFMDKNKSNVFAAWLNVIKNIKLTKAK